MLPLGTKQQLTLLEREYQKYKRICYGQEANKPRTINSVKEQLPKEKETKQERRKSNEKDKKEKKNKRKQKRKLTVRKKEVIDRGKWNNR